MVIVKKGTHSDKEADKSVKLMGDILDVRPFTCP